MNHSKLFSLAVAAILSILLSNLLLGNPAKPQQAAAISGSQFRPGRIIDDAIFFNGDAMSPSQIQAFLNAKFEGLTCASGHTCLKDYYVTSTPQKIPESGLCGHLPAKSNQSAAQIIYDVGKACGISQKVLLVLLQKEMGLVTRTAPTAWHYERATGYDCPDTNPPTCNPNHAGYFNQVFMAARVYKWYALNNGPNYRRHQNNYIQYNPDPACGGSMVYIENQATAGLYNYTPYQPNAATLAVGLGVTAPCGAYGNKNFWWYYNLWFGSPINDAYAWEIVHEVSAGKLYLVVNNRRHWIPGPALLEAWGLENQAYRDVDSTYINQLSAGSNLTRVALDLNNTRYFMSQGKKHRLKSDAYVLAWGVAGMQHISAPGLLSITPSGGDAGRFAKTQYGDTYLLNNYTKHLPAHEDSFTHWGINESNTTNVLEGDIIHIPDGDAVDQAINFSGIVRIADRGNYLSFKSSAVADGWSTIDSIITYPFAINLLPIMPVGSFVSPLNSNRVYFIEGGKHHYVPSPSHANLWGIGRANPISTVSQSLFDNLVSGSNIGFVAKGASSGNTYLLAGSKRQFANPNLATIYTGTSSIPTYTDASLSTIPSGGLIKSSVVKFPSIPKVYSFDDGKLRHISSPIVLDAFGGYNNNPLTTLPDSLANLVQTGSNLDYKIYDGTNTWYLENGYRYKINENYIGTWRANGASVVSPELIEEFINSGREVGAAVQYAGKRYLVNNGVLIDVSSSYASFGLSISSFVNLTRQYMPTTTAEGYFVQSMTNPRVYVLSYGNLYHVSNFQTLSDLGYGRFSGIIPLHPEIINHTLNVRPTKASRLIKAINTGALFVSNAKGYTFPSLITLTNYKGGEDYMVLNKKYFDMFQPSGVASIVITGNDGKVYAVDNGQKRWVTGPSVLKSSFPGIPLLVLPQPTVDGFSNGPNLN